VRDEQLSVNAERLGIIPRRVECYCCSKSIDYWLEEKDCFNAIVISDEESDLAWDICLRFRDYGLLAKPTWQQDKICTAISNH
jgi:ornithine--oxo-acid transaminase